VGVSAPCHTTTLRAEIVQQSGKEPDAIKYFVTWCGGEIGSLSGGLQLRPKFNSRQKVGIKDMEYLVLHFKTMLQNRWE